ncbi:MAG: nuclear transport factor 2 family protein [Alphaproteobacteria bacterium]|nr:MAG: nuclear transport factor 2 family protein [Alphaproteobacteria bacterium]
MIFWASVCGMHPPFRRALHWRSGPRRLYKAATGASPVSVQELAMPGAAGEKEAQALVRRFLDLMEARDLEAASGLLAEAAVMEFPGGVRFGRLEELVAWAAPRYRWVRKSYDATESCRLPDGAVAVWCIGTLEGEWPDGTAFSGIRFVDRFEVAGGRIRRQQVWNDLAEHRAAR